MSEVNESNLFANILSWQGQQLEPNNIQKNVAILKKMKAECLINTHGGRVIQGGIEIDLSVRISFRSSKNIDGEPEHPVDETIFYEIIEEEIGNIFKNRQFQSDHRMANSYLHALKVIRKVCPAWIDKRKIRPRTGFERDKADILRDFLTNCLEELSPFNPPTPTEAATAAQIRQWVEYFILRRQYVDGMPQDQVRTELANKISKRIIGGAFNRFQKAGRSRLATLIYQKEIELRKEQKNEN